VTELRREIILNVDDDDAGRYATSRILRQAGFEVREAVTGAEALQKAAQGPDLVILDVNLPDLSGFEVCRRLKADPATRHLLVLHLSATFLQPGDRIAGLEGGADAYLVHPLDPGELTATVRALLRLKEAEEEVRRSEERFRHLAENSADIICRFELKPTPHFAYVSLAVIRILGYAPEEHYADPELRLKIVHPEDRPLLEQCLRG
jgi:DNA-binding response OmpR family regulator